jgi:hypothetical protein
MGAPDRWACVVLIFQKKDSLGMLLQIYVLASIDLQRAAKENVVLLMLVQNMNGTMVTYTGTCPRNHHLHWSETWYTYGLFDIFMQNFVRKWRNGLPQSYVQQGYVQLKAS